MSRAGSAASIACAIAALAIAMRTAAADFGTPGGPEPANAGEIATQLRRDPYDVELLISFGTSKGGSAGHLALALRDPAGGDDVVWSANFYADRAREHEKGFHTSELMLAIPKQEYLFGTSSSLGDTASFGLDFGEIYKRSVVGVRVYGVPASERAALAAYFRRINDDYRSKARNTEYHDDEIRYGYLELNCAKSIGVAFRYGAGYTNLEIASSKRPARRKLATAVNANIPAEMAIKLLEEWNARGYGMEVVLYRKYVGSTYVDPHDDEKVAFKDLPDRFPSVLSRDFSKDAGEYRDADNLYAMYLLYNLGRYAVRVDQATKLLEIAEHKTALPYPEASRLAAESAKADAEGYRRGLLFGSKGKRIAAAPD